MKLLCALALVSLASASFVIDEVATGKHYAVYFHGDFDKDPLCAKLNCKRHEACLVRDNAALCVKKHKLKDVQGVVSHHKDEGWDRERYEEKLAKHKEAVAEKIKANDYYTTDNGKVYKQRKSKHQHEHSGRHDMQRRDCDEKSLRGIGGRLLQWFSDIHAHAEAEDGSPLPAHRVACRPDVAWMFQQWDGDKDGELSVEELRPLDEDKNEACVSPFLDRCDSDGDDAVTLDEWCDCFAWADDSGRHEPPCHAEKHRRDPHLLGAFHPRCDLEGYYKPEQCHEHQCWCVDKYGREFDNSRVSAQLPDCGQYANIVNDDDIHELEQEL